MITPKIKALFQLIEYLHSNIDEFNKYNYLIDELDSLYEKRNKLEHEKNYFEKKEYEKLQNEINQKRKSLLQNTIEKAINKATDLNIFNPKTYASIYNQNNDEAFNIINVVDDKDLPIILKSKQQYIEFRTKTRNAILQQKDLYNKLDLILKVVFIYFDKETENEFAKLPKYEQLTVKRHYSKPSRQLAKTIKEKLSAFNFFQIEIIADLEYEGKIYNNVKQKNNDSILTPENWEQHKDTFFKQRMATYKNSYTLNERIKLELETLEKLPINKTDYQILKDRYKKYLKAIPHQQTETKSETITKLTDLITHQNSIEIVKNIKIKYKNIKGKRLKLLLLAFQNLGLLPKERIAKKFHDFCKNEFNWNIASYNAMNGYVYNNHIDKDELQSMEQYIVSFIKTN